MLISGRLYIDNNADGHYSRPPDTPIANTPIVVAKSTISKVRAARDNLDQGMTDQNGAFSISIPQQAAGVGLEIAFSNGTLIRRFFVDSSGHVPEVEGNIVPSGGGKVNNWCNVDVGLCLHSQFPSFLDLAANACNENCFNLRTRTSHFYKSTQSHNNDSQNDNRGN